MRIVALYKTFDGEEWIDASLMSIYRHVDAIVMVHSDSSWLGERGNTVRQEAARWCSEHDGAGKAHHLDVDVRSQEEQYRAGIDYIKSRGIPYDVVLAVDADEIWDAADLDRAKQQIANDHSGLPAFRCNMHSYLRTPFYRVHPPFGSPTTFVRQPELLTQSPRGCRAPATQLDNVWMHHFTYVRETDERVFRKIRQSCAADGDETLVTHWEDTVWKHLPDGGNLHAFARWRNVWQRIQRVWKPDLPEAVRSARIMRHFLPASLMMDGEQNALLRIAAGRHQAVDLGTFQGSSAVILSLACHQVHTVDAYEGVLERAITANRDDEYDVLWNANRHTLESVRRTLNHYGNITSEQNDTVLAAEAWPRRDVDLLFVDADHSCAGTRANWQAWWPKLSPGAILLFHDNNEIHPGVQEAVRELEGMPTKVQRVDLGEYSGSLAGFIKVEA